jgi:beta propeller repeat protein
VWSKDFFNGIHVFDLASGTDSQLDVGSGWSVCGPEVSGRTVVWMDGRKRHNNGFDIYGYGLNNGREFLISSGDEDTWDPDISGATVVWMASQPDDFTWETGDILACDLGAKTQYSVCSSSGSQVRPAISGHIVVWEDHRNGNADIYGYDLATKRELPVCVAPGDQTRPDISGLTVVWEDTRNGTSDIYGVLLTP